MIVEPVPTNPRSPIRRLLRVLGLTAPVLLLVAVVAVGAFGPPPAAPASDAPATPDPAGPTRPPALVVDGEAVSFPETWIGLRVRGIADTRAEQAAGHAQGVIAVAGYLSYGSRSWTCNDEYLEVDTLRVRRAGDALGPPIVGLGTPPPRLRAAHEGARGRRRARLPAP